MAKENKTEFEFSAGGVVKNKTEALLIRTKTLKGRVVWTFPKGKIEREETPRDAALREVCEETGYRCRIEKELDRVSYFYRRGGKLISKKVKWYEMSPLEKERKHDDEVDLVEWMSPEKAQEKLSYKSDMNLLRKVFREK